MNENISGIFSFLDKSKTPYHGVAEVRKMLEADGFQYLSEAERWSLAPGGKYFVIRGGSSIIAFKNQGFGFMIAASHSDSPTFRVKGEIKSSGSLKLDVEKYGGTLFYTWLDKPLTVAGRAVVREAGALSVRLCDLSPASVVIPSLAIHMNRDVNEGLKLNPAVDMRPLASLNEDIKILELIASSLGVKCEDVVSFDLFLSPMQNAAICGLENEFVLSPRIDNLGCVYTTTKAFLEPSPANSTSVLAIFNNEETGSETKQGAASTFLYDVLRRISADESEYCMRVACGMMLSADNAHAIHPNHPELSDGENAPRLAGGVVIKYNANQRYATDAVSDGVFREICREAGVPVQSFYTRADKPCGSTLGSISNTVVPISTVDIGMPQLAMHSSAELMALKDADYMYSAIKAFFSKAIKVNDGKITIV